MAIQAFSIKQIAKTVPGVKQFVGSFKHEGPGAWVFQRPVLAWLTEPSLKKQLPVSYQVFASYCSLFFKLTGAGYLRGGYGLFRAIARFSNQDYLRLQLPDCEVFLDARDLRLFAVVNELMNCHADPRILSCFLSEGDTFIDVGANHGSFSIVASKLVGASGKIIAVEPQPRLATAVEQSLTVNALGEFQVHQMAVGDGEGEVELMIPNDTSGSAGLYQAHSGTHQHQKITVPIKRLDDLIDWQNLPLGKTVIKLDVEGCEYAFLRGAKALIQARQPLLMMEINPSTLEASQTTGTDLKQLLRELGYTSYAELRSLDQTHSIEQLDTGSWRNIIAFVN